MCDCEEKEKDREVEKSQQPDPYPLQKGRVFHAPSQKKVKIELLVILMCVAVAYWLLLDVVIIQ